MNILGTADYKIIHGDAIEALENEISDNSIDLIFADPPYNIGKNGQVMTSIFNGAISGWIYVCEN